ncbi:transglutaminase-like domain-containing protein [Peterkaempfera bronchialis]|uniref:Transglutaminase family protein n=1 Tax=Peterkaempfera bronchialis TaxID=2126346 RepID=A0A345T2B1_9ACTN|nr:transglutaminase family protein [Peterkaempfera bronchialis]AXI80116.1 transglutaminase family protein [Peterkaempfera bronchialis]
MAQSDPFLRETRFCNFSHPTLQHLAEELRSAGDDARETAVDAFRLVRDSVKYEVGNWQRTAAETLARGSGTCTNSSNLLVALLRSLGIPAGYGVMSVRGREYFGPVAPPRLSRFVAPVSKHVYAYVQLDGAWLRCDPSDDEALSLGSRHLNPQSEVVDWDGTGHAMLNLHPDHILEDRGPVADIDAIMRKPMRLAMRVPVRIGNCYLDFLRQEGARMRTAPEAEEHFQRWLLHRYPVYGRIYRALPSGAPHAPQAPQAEPAAP